MYTYLQFNRKHTTSMTIIYLTCGDAMSRHTATSSTAAALTWGPQDAELVQ